MTLNQLVYVVEVAKTKSINATAHSLYVAQSTISIAVKELEEELGITIFNRNNRGIVITKEGEDFIHYANNIIQQCKMLKEKYTGEVKQKEHFSVVMHHSTFAAKAFAEVVKIFGMKDYEYSLFETKTKNVLDNVAGAKCDIGILYISNYNLDYYERLFRENNLKFNNIAEYEVFAYVSEKHPLSEKSVIELSELENYPCLLFEQDENSSYYFYEEIISAYEYKNVIHTSDRATTMDLLRELDAYSVGIGNVKSSRTTEGVHAIKINTDEKINVGYLVRRDSNISEITQKFIELFTKISQNDKEN